MKDKLDKEIEMAFKARGLMESMQQWDAEMARKQTIIRLIPRVFAPIAIAAMLVGVFFVPFGGLASTEGRHFADQNITQYTSYVSMKGSEEAVDYLANAYCALQNKEYTIAAKESKKAIRLLQGASDPFKVDMLQDAEWYNALANLSRGQLWYTIKAKKDIKRIADNPGKHQEEAKKLLEKLNLEKR